MISINIVNDQTGTDENANYDFTVSINGNQIDCGKVLGHNRSDNWKMLVNLLLYGAMTEGEREYQFITHILRRWDRERIERFCQHLIGDKVADDTFSGASDAKCESCGNPSNGYTADDVPLCDACGAALIEQNKVYELTPCAACGAVGFHLMDCPLFSYQCSICGARVSRGNQSTHTHPVLPIHL